MGIPRCSTVGGIAELSDTAASRRSSPNPAGEEEHSCRISASQLGGLRIRAAIHLARHAPCRISRGGAPPEALRDDPIQQHDARPRPIRVPPSTDSAGKERRSAKPGERRMIDNRMHGRCHHRPRDRGFQWYGDDWHPRGSMQAGLNQEHVQQVHRPVGQMFITVGMIDMRPNTSQNRCGSGGHGLSGAGKTSRNRTQSSAVNAS